MGAAIGRQVSAEDVETLCDSKLRTLGCAHEGGRLGARAAALEPVAGAAVQVRRLRPGRHQADHRPVRAALRAGRRGGPRGRVPRGRAAGCCCTRAGVGHPPGVRPARPAAGRLRADGRVGRVPRVRARRGRPLRRVDARRHGHRSLPRVAGVLHRRHRQLPARSRGTGAHRPRWPLLQRHRRRGDVRRLVGHRAGTPSCSSSRPRCCRWCASWRRSCGSTATTSWPTSPACPTSTTGSSRPSSACFPRHWNDPEAKVLKPWAQGRGHRVGRRRGPAAAVLPRDDGPELPPGGGDRLGLRRAAVGAARDAARRRRRAGRRGAGRCRSSPSPCRCSASCSSSPGSSEQVVAGTWRATEDRPVRRALAGVVALAVVAGLAWSWWPQPGTYRPVQAYERGTLADAVSSTLRSGVPTSPAGGAAGRGPGGVAAGCRAADRRGARSSRSSWCREAARPRPTARRCPPGSSRSTVRCRPGEGGNQAMAVNTTDGSTLYDVAFALVWADGDTVANTNEAYACVLHRVPDRGRRLPGRPRPRGGQRRGPGERRRGRQLQLRPVRHPGARDPARGDPVRTAERRRAPPSSPRCGRRSPPSAPPSRTSRSASSRTG